MFCCAREIVGRVNEFPIRRQIDEIGTAGRGGIAAGNGGAWGTFLNARISAMIDFLSELL